MDNMEIDLNFHNILCDKDAEEKLKEFLLFRKVVKVEEVDDQTANITLDNGAVLRTRGNEGCGGCGMGWYYLTALNSCDNAITNVEVSINDAETVFSIFVFAENKQINMVTYEGDDNGYYGTGFYLTAYLPEAQI